jgi:hypothetical protein
MGMLWSVLAQPWLWFPESSRDELDECVVGQVGWAAGFMVHGSNGSTGICVD